MSSAGAPVSPPPLRGLTMPSARCTVPVCALAASPAALSSTVPKAATPRAAAAAGRADRVPDPAAVAPRPCDALPCGTAISGATSGGWLGGCSGSESGSGDIRRWRLLPANGCPSDLKCHACCSCDSCRCCCWCCSCSWCSCWSWSEARCSCIGDGAGNADRLITGKCGWSPPAAAPRSPPP